MLDIKALLLKLVNHYNNVGAVYTGSGTVSSLASGTSLVTLGSIGTGTNKDPYLPAGIYLCNAHMEVGGYSSGYRLVQLGYTPQNGSVINKGASRVQIPSPGATYGIWINAFGAIKSDVPFTLHCRGCQNKGSAAANVEWGLRAVKIK